ncbi:MAG: ferrous iron transport protein A [Desulfobulbaceae bacterium]|jgi:Fe2+ transport system protein FeoA|nr:ferrous iron transport protein A [Desulfobulbaceae bacterium]
MCLSEVKKGQRVSIVAISDANIRTQFIRFGISEGSLIKCLEKIPFGPLMILHHRQEIAVGQEVAKNILVNGEC